jgi:hypothetical protein
MKTYTYAGSIAAVAVLLSASFASAQTISASASVQGSVHGGAWGHGKEMEHLPGVFGTVSAVSGDTITLQSKGYGQNASPTTYTVDASGATVVKDGQSSSVSSLAVGDTVMVQGSVSGSAVSATRISDGKPQGMPARMGNQGPVIQGNGEPVIGGSVSAISGNTLTVATKAGATYTVDASSAVVSKNHATSSVSSITVGDSVIVQGSVNGSAVSASSILDQNANAAAGANGSVKIGMMGGFFGAIGGFFHSLFGFF